MPTSEQIEAAAKTYWDCLGRDNGFPTPWDQAPITQILPAMKAALLAAEKVAPCVQEDIPEINDFVRGAVSEAIYQRKRYPSEQDEGKSPFDWFWLIGYLAQKAADAAVRGDTDKAKHHTISTAAALVNWHANLSGAHTDMRPGIFPPEAAQ